MTPVKQWYALRVRGGREEKIKAKIEEAFTNRDAEAIFDRIILPYERSYVIKKGKKELKKRYFPYLLLHVAIEDKCVIPLLRSIDGIYGFVGHAGWSNKELPSPIPPAEIDKMIGKVDHTQATEGEIAQEFVQGDTVDIIDGPFQDNTVTLVSVNPARKKVKVMINFMGQNVVELSYHQIAKTKQA